MAWYRCTGEGGAVVQSPKIQLMHESGENQQLIYTVPESGMYMFLQYTSHNGTNQIILPNGNIPIIDDYINRTAEIPSGEVVFRIVIANLSANEEVILNGNTDAWWLAITKQIYKLENINNISFYHKDTTNDGTVTYTVTQNNDTYLVIGICGGRSDGEYRDNTVTTSSAVIPKSYIGYHTITNIYYGKGNNIPEINMFGYNGNNSIVYAMKTS